MLIVDVGSASVGAAIVKLNGSEKPEILGTARTAITFQEELNFSRFTNAMLSALDQTLAALGGGKQPRPELCTVALASPWYVSETKQVTYERERAFEVTPELVDDLIAHERSLLVARYDKEEGQDKKKKKEHHVAVVEAQAIGIKLNGYEVDDPYNKTAKHLTLAVVTSIAQAKVIDALKTRIRLAFYYDEIIFRSFPLVGFTVLRDLVPSVPSFLFIDVTGEVTDISIVRDGTLEDTVTFPLGKNFIVRRITSMMRTTPEEGLSLLRLAQQQKVESGTAAKIDHIFSQTEKDWSHALSSALSQLAASRALPHVVFYTADTDVAGWFGQAIKREAFGQFTAADNAFDVRYLGDEIMEPFVEYHSGVQRDVFCAVESIFAAHVAHEPHDG